MNEIQRIQLLSLIAISGDFPAEELGSLGSLSYKQKLITALKQERMITVYNKDGLKSYRLTAKAKRELLSANFSRFEFYLTGNAETNLYRGDVTRRLRLHRIAQAFVMMQKSGVKIYRDEKTPLFTSSAYSVESVGSVNTVKLQTPVFYDSREIKCIGLEAIKIKNSRSVGILITENTAYIVFNTLDTLLKWESRSETKNLTVLTHFLRQALGEKAPKEIKGLVIGSGMDIAMQILRSTGGFKRRYLMLDETFYNLLYIPNTNDGLLVLSILASDKIRDELRSILSYGLTDAKTAFVDCDGLDSDGTPVLFAYDCDLQRLTRFNAGVSNRKTHGIIMCFEFQQQVLKEYCNPDYVTIRTISEAKFKRRFFPEQST